MRITHRLQRVAKALTPVAATDWAATGRLPKLIGDYEAGRYVTSCPCCVVFLNAMLHDMRVMVAMPVDEWEFAPVTAGPIPDHLREVLHGCAYQA